MKKLFLLFVAAVCISCSPKQSDQSVLIIYDELEQMQVLKDFITSEENISVTLVDAKEVKDISEYDAVIVYIHGKLAESIELKVIEYTKNGGKFIPLHHTISSGKRANKYYFDFMGMELKKAPVDSGGYGYKEHIELTMVNLDTTHFITTNNIVWPEKTGYTSTDVSPDQKIFPSFAFHSSEMYINHIYTDSTEKRILCGSKFFDTERDKWWMQDRGAWIKKAGKGTIIYFMPGHDAFEFEYPVFRQMILNAILYK